MRALVCPEAEYLVSEFYCPNPSGNSQAARFAGPEGEYSATEIAGPEVEYSVTEIAGPEAEYSVTEIAGPEAGYLEVGARQRGWEDKPLSQRPLQGPLQWRSGPPPLRSVAYPAQCLLDQPPQGP